MNSNDGLLWASSYSPPYNAMKYYNYKLFSSIPYMGTGIYSSVEDYQEKKLSYINRKRESVIPYTITLKKFIYSLAYQVFEDNRFKLPYIDYNKKHDEYAIGVVRKGSGYMRYFGDWQEATKACYKYSIEKVHNKPIFYKHPTRIWYITIDTIYSETITNNP